LLYPPHSISITESFSKEKLYSQAATREEMGGPSLKSTSLVVGFGGIHRGKVAGD
jgi:hypothetical protein